MYFEVFCPLRYKDYTGCEGDGDGGATELAGHNLEAHCILHRAKEVHEEAEGENISDEREGEVEKLVGQDLDVHNCR